MHGAKNIKFHMGSIVSHIDIDAINVPLPQHTLPSNGKTYNMLVRYTNL